MKKVLALAAMTAMSAAAYAGIVLNPMVGDNMVLQQQAQARVWGNAAKGAEVEITPSWSGKPVMVKADADGRWEARLTTPRGSFDTYTIRFTDKSDGDTVDINNVLVGEVWLASGQSNMQMPLKGYPACCVKGGYDEVASAGKRAGEVRFITVPLTQSYEKLDTVAARWVVPSPETAPEFSAVAWHLAGRVADVMEVPVGIVSAAYGGAKVESWTPEEVVATYSDVSLDRDSIERMVHYYRPFKMYNAMFNPVKPYTYKGILWYQGCSNVDSYTTYAERLARMVEIWRNEIGDGDIPFYMVEIAPYDYGGWDSGAYLREAQWDAAEMIPNCGIISTNDLVEPYERLNIHPSEKKEVGYRLANLVLNKTYGKKQFPVEHPRFKSATPDGHKLLVSFTTNSDNLCRNYDVKGFEIAGADKVFYPAQVENVNDWNNTVTLSSEKVEAPLYVRYCFHDFMPGTMYGGNFLPLVPFRSDR